MQQERGGDNQRYRGQGSGGSGVALSSEDDVGQDGKSRQALEQQARELKRRKWRKWLDSGFYEGIVRIKLDEIGVRDELDLGKNEWRALENRARRYIVADRNEARLVWKERDGQLAFCV